MKKPPQSTLRDRIIEKMPEILELIDAEHRYANIRLDHDGDFRFDVVRFIKEIAELEATPKFAALRAFTRVAKDVDRLKLSIAALPPSARSMVKLTIDGLDDAEKMAEKETGRTEAKRKPLAARASFELIMEYGSMDMSLSADGSYVKLAALLYFVATRKWSNLRSSCTKHFDDIKLDAGIDFRPTGIDFRLSRPLSKEDEATALKREQKRRRYVAVVAAWPPLEDVVDEVLG